MKDILKGVIKNRLLISASLVASVFAVVIVRNYDITIAFVTAAIVIALNIIMIAPRLVAAFVLLVAQAVFILNLNSMVIISSATGEYAGLIGVAIAYQAYTFILLPLITLVYYFKALGRVWVNLLITIIVFDFGIFLGIYDGTIPVLVTISIASAFLGIGIVIGKGYLISKRYQNDIEIPKAKRLLALPKMKDVTVEFEEQAYGLQFNKTKHLFIAHLPALNGSVKIKENGIYIGGYNYNKEVEWMLSKNRASGTPTLIIIDINSDSPKIKKISFKTPQQPDFMLGSVLVMNLDEFKKFLTN